MMIPFALFFFLIPETFWNFRNLISDGNIIGSSNIERFDIGEADYPIIGNSGGPTIQNFTSVVEPEFNECTAERFFKVRKAL